MPRAVRAFLLFAVWDLAASAAVVYGQARPLLGLVVVLLLTGALLWGNLLRDPTGEELPWLRLAPLPEPAWRWMAGGVVAFLVFNFAIGEVYTGLVPVPPDNFDPFPQLMRDPLSRLSITVFAVAIAPFVEELVFRGFIQRSLERRWGTVAGITSAAFLFALCHFKPWILPLLFLIGATNGFAVYLTGSLWAGVILHAANNAIAMLGLGAEADRPTLTPTLWQAGPTREWWLSLALALLSGAALVHIGRALGRARRDGIPLAEDDR